MHTRDAAGGKKPPVEGSRGGLARTDGGGAKAVTTKSSPHERRDMTDSSFTLLEVHLGDGDIEIGPFELFGASDETAAITESETEAEAETDEGDTDSDGGVSALSAAGLLLALAALIAVGVGVAKLRGDDEVPSGIAGDE
jgi:hypothetical protein